METRVPFPGEWFEIAGHDNGLFTADCTVGDRPLGPEHLFHGDPEGQEQ